MHDEWDLMTMVIGYQKSAERELLGKVLGLWMGGNLY